MYEVIWKETPADKEARITFTRENKAVEFYNQKKLTAFEARYLGEISSFINGDILTMEDRMGYLEREEKLLLFRDKDELQKTLDYLRNQDRHYAVTGEWAGDIPFWYLCLNE